MSHKKLILALVSIIILGGITYLALPKKDPMVQPTGITTSEESSQASASPTSTSSNEAILDFMINDLTKEETAAALKTLDESSPSSSSEASAQLETNF
jgi:hypothetical protein